MAETLTYAQNLAVNNRGGKLLVSAAAGSGKTKVLVDRLLKYLTDPVDPANIDEFLIITYTKAAAAELRAKIAEKLSERIASDPGNRHLQRQMQRLYLTKISTVHAFCADILREYTYRLDIAPDFSVGDEQECMQLRLRAMDAVLENAYESIHENPDFQAFVNTQGLGRSDALIPEIIERVYDSAMCHLYPQQWCERCMNDAETDAIYEPFDTLWGSYLAQTLFACLDDYIAAMQRCCNLITAAEGLEKPAQLLRDTVYQLEKLRDSKTWDEIIERKNIDYGRLTFPKKYDDPALTEPIKAVRKACKETLEKKLRWFSDPAERVLEDLRQAAPAAKGLFALVKAFGDGYGKLKRSARLLDFSDLEHRTLDLLLGKTRSYVTAAAKEIGSRFREIMVDEYQDSNQVQDAIFSALTEEKQNLFMVGDVKQSIYQFRLADPDIFLSKYADYADAESERPGAGCRILLSSNFRSGSGVISAVNDVFRDCMSERVGGLMYGDQEALLEGIPHCDIGEPEVEFHGISVNEDTYAEEATFVARRILALLDGSHYVRDGDDLRPININDIVILLRSPGSVGMEYQWALEQHGIPCAGSVGGDLLLTEEIGTLRALLQIISNPRQDIPLIAVLASPVFGFTANELAQLRSSHKYGSIYDALLCCPSYKCKTFLEKLATLRKAAPMLTLAELLALIFRITKMEAIYSAMADGETRKSNLQSFYQLAVDFSAVNSGNLDRFLGHLDAMEEKGLATPLERTSGCVTIMSIHKSKGLEFPVVFLCGLSRKFNREDLKQQVLCHKQLGLGLSCIDTKNRVRYPTLSRYAISAKIADESLSEEMRVLYVAMTRARDRLIMTYASQNLEKDIHDIAMRMNLSGQQLMTADVSCPGQWILYSALKRTEAGALFALGGNHGTTRVSENPWKITVSDGFLTTASHAPIADTDTEYQESVDLTVVSRLLKYRYGHIEATVTPSKQTATQKKGRHIDDEAAENAGVQKPVYRTWRKPSFADGSADGTVYGNTVHKIMQYIVFERCSDLDSLKEELSRLTAESYITEEQRASVDCKKLLAFFLSPLGCRLRESRDVLREFKFSILDDASNYCGGLEGEKVLLQGVVDCALIEDDGITVVDFKTDRVTEDTIEQVVARYKDQVATYARALKHIFGKPVKAKALYLFAIDRFVWINETDALI